MADEKRAQIRGPSVSAASSSASTGSTPLERMKQALELGRRGRLLKKLAGRGSHRTTSVD